MGKPASGILNRCDYRRFPVGAYLGAEALEQGIDAMVSSRNRVLNQTPSQPQRKLVVTNSLLLWVAKRAATVITGGRRVDVNGYISEGAGETCLK